MLTSLPQAKWLRYEPIDDDTARDGATLAFGKPLNVIPRLRDARMVLALDADPLGAGPEQIRFARDLTAARRSHDAQDFLRLYAAEPAWSLTGAYADHRLALAPQLIGTVAVLVANALGASLPVGSLPPDAEGFARAVAADLKARPGQALVMAGRRLPPDVHALCHWINGQLKAPVDLIEPVDPVVDGHSATLHALADDIKADRVQTLLVLDANPAYDTPGDLRLADAIAAVPFSAHLGLYDDETAARCTFRLPRSHELESWSDLRAFDGTASIVQPLIRPLYDTRTVSETLSLIGGATGSAYDLVRATWQPHGSGDFDDWWRQALESGVIAGSAIAAGRGARRPGCRGSHRRPPATASASCCRRIRRCGMAASPTMPGCRNAPSR